MSRVELLEYWCNESGAGVDLRVQLSNSVFTAEPFPGGLRFIMHEQFDDVGKAESRVNEFLRSTHAHEILQTGAKRREFLLKSARMSDGSTSAYLHHQLTVTGELAAANYAKEHPWRAYLNESPLAYALARRFDEYLAGREQLVVIGYFVLTAIEHEFGGAPSAATRLNVSSKVIERQSRLVSSVGTLRSARKITKTLELRDLTTAEIFWMERVLVELINRLARISRDEDVGQRLTNGDLPSA